MRTESSAETVLPVDSLSEPAGGRGTVLGGSVGRAVLVLALPVLAEQLLNSLVGIVDTFLAGRISTEATSAIGLAAYVGWLVSMLFMLVGTGTTALVARCIGSGSPREANEFANQSLGLAVWMGLGAMVLIYAITPMLAGVQLMTGATYDIVVRYLRIEATSHVFMSLTLIGSAAFRGVGDMRTPLKILATVSIVNMIVSPLLMYGVGPFPALGLDGIVAGTVVARVLGGVLMIVILLRGRSGLRIDKGMFQPAAEQVRRILRIGGPAALDGAIMWSGHFVFLRVIAQLADGALGQAYYAAHIIAVRVESLTYLPAVAFAAATATIIGQSLGANDPERAKRAGHQAVRQCGILAVGLTVVYYFGADAIFRAMHIDPLVREVGPPAWRMLAFFQIFLTTSIIYVGALRGAGDTRFPLLFTIVCIGFVRLPLAYLFGIVLDGGLIGAWVGMCGDMTMRAILATIRFARGGWVKTRV